MVVSARIYRMQNKDYTTILAPVHMAGKDMLAESGIQTSMFQVSVSYLNSMQNPLIVLNANIVFK